ncbi:xanthine dehydrogenase family protein molybdopterin-binding subunit [Mesorhizobium microcysteis]|uniref:Xanthine dehydrogenase family protein molybdopterin-binding subunit n=1 Tax=Neoaquamicrobium microcysteis TaxID=2682781 RepID=A0A5D4H2R9_9HYPH|nr:molybdopterin cofactor-binding domain-containing protein [Mesorhizobium microcysteis]TYR34553.1 xanthine dehydrogenase family protein molybdopterin-binding subunit [Mesorhizobium microcysteis]
MSRLGTFTRRAFLLGAATVAGGVAVGYWYYRQPYPNPLEDELAEGEVTFNPYVKVSSDDTITLIAPRAEMGQGISTTLAAFVAEELDVSLDRVTVEHGPPSYAYYNAAMLEEGGGFNFWDESFTAETVRGLMGVAGKMLGLQATGGSTATRDGFERMRQAGAAARIMLVDAAAARLGVAANELATENGTIVHRASNRSLTYGEVALDAAQIKPPSSVVLKERADWKLLGKSQPRVDMLDKVTGAPIFGIDVRQPDMLFATVRISPVFGVAPVRSDISAASAMPGVVKIVPIETLYGSGFGVIAENTWAAFKAAEAIDVEWGEPGYPKANDEIMATFTQAARSGDASAMRDDGNVDVAFADAPQERVIEAEYSVPYLAHAPMEPMNCTARLKDGVLDIWAPNQMPVLVRWFCSDLAGVPGGKTNVHTTSMGGAFGRRGELDYALYATLLAKETDGRPVQVTWTREEDTRRGPFRPASAGHFRARIGEDGLPVAVDMRIAAQNMMSSLMGRTFPSLPAGGSDPSITDGARNQPYTIPNYRVSEIQVPLAIPVTFWRSVGNSVNGFFHEGFMDEIAHAGQVDPVEMRRRLMADFPAAIAVVDKVAEMSNWGETLPAGKAKGFAFTLSFGSWCGQVIQIAETPAGIKLEKMWIAVDVGMAIDPAIIEAQMTSGAIFGLSAAMGQQITFSEGVVEQSNFHDYDAMRIFQAPEFEVAIIENFHRMGGVGEVGTPPAAPALANAIFALTGKRIRQLPLSREVSFA